MHAADHRALQVDARTGAGADLCHRAVDGASGGDVSRLRVVSATDIPLTRATALAMKLALVTGQRIGEVVGMTTAELDLNDTAPVWTLPSERTKTGQANRVPLSPLAVRLIGEARALQKRADGEAAYYVIAYSRIPP